MGATLSSRRECAGRGEAGSGSLNLVVDGTERRWFSYTPEEPDPAEEQAAWDNLWPEPASQVAPRNCFTVLRFHVPADDDEPFFAATDLVVPVVDGIPLFEMLGGGWPGIPAKWVLPPSRQWLGSPEYVEYGRAIVLDGSCGSAGCCGVVARISVLTDTVIWDEFHGHSATQPPERLQFEFDRDDYEAQLGNLPRLAVTEWDADTLDRKSVV